MTAPFLRPLQCSMTVDHASARMPPAFRDLARRACACLIWRKGRLVRSGGPTLGPASLPAPWALRLVQMEAARVTSLLAEQDDAAGDTAGEVAGGERAGHGRRSKRTCTVVEVSRGEATSNDLE